jgi:hypothetical protein
MLGGLMEKNIFMLIMHAVILAIILTGCASVGHDFNYSATSTFELGQLNKSECQNLIGGEPFKTSVVTDNNGNFEIIRYEYAHGNIATLKSRLVILEFKNDLLNAYVRTSSFDEDKTDYPADRTKDIKKGISTKNEVSTLLGIAQGRGRCPSNLEDYKLRCTNGAEVWSWITMSQLSTLGHTYAAQQVKYNSIFITFDNKDIVSDIQISQDL